MPSKLYLHGDSDAVWLADPADRVLDAVETALQQGTQFLRLDMPPFAHQDARRPAYFKPSAVSAVLPVHPDEWQYALDNPPDWLHHDD